MILDLTTMKSSQIYHTMTQTLIPRPVAWVLSQHENGHFNLAPFSYFTAVSSAPALLMFSVGNKPSGEQKDTKENIAETDYFVVHIAASNQAESVTESSRGLPAEESELNHISETLVEFEGFPLPRLEKAPVAFGCRLHHTQQVEGAPQTLVFGEIERIYIADSCCETQRKERPDGSVSERLMVNALKVDPIARLGADQYGTLGKILSIPRPK